MSLNNMYFKKNINSHIFKKKNTKEKSGMMSHSDKSL